MAMVLGSPPNRVLREIREVAGQTQREMGECLGRSQSVISAVESGAKACSASCALAVADAYRPILHRLGITVEDILRGERRSYSAAAS